MSGPVIEAPPRRYWTSRNFDPDGPALWKNATDADIAALLRWADRADDPIGSWHHGAVPTPAIDALAERVRHELNDGCGVVRISPPQGAMQHELAMRLSYLALGTSMGTVAENYGRLYDVTDRGVSYKQDRVPVSMSRESTGMHTDSSAVAFEPDYVGLLCVRPAPSGGRSRVVSAASVHRKLLRESPKLAARLERDFIRDVVTPGYARDPERLRANSFPVFDPEHGMTFRYMRYWIESGHAAAGATLDLVDIEAFDALDRALHDPELLVEFDMASGEQLWIANRTVAHDRTEYTDDPQAPRLMVRQWVTAHPGGQTPLPSTST